MQSKSSNFFKTLQIRYLYYSALRVTKVPPSSIVDSVKSMKFENIYTQQSRL